MGASAAASHAERAASALVLSKALGEELVNCSWSHADSSTAGMRTNSTRFQSEATAHETPVSTPGIACIPCQKAHAALSGCHKRPSRTAVVGATCQHSRQSLYASLLHPSARQTGPWYLRPLESHALGGADVETDAKGPQEQQRMHTVPSSSVSQRPLSTLSQQKCPGDRVSLFAGCQIYAPRAKQPPDEPQARSARGGSRGHEGPVPHPGARPRRRPCAVRVEPARDVSGVLWREW